MTDYKPDNVAALSQEDIIRWHRRYKHDPDDVIALREADYRNTAESRRRYALLVHMVHFISHKQFKRELIEALYHPDRYEKMVKTYGEVWADIHLP